MKLPSRGILGSGRYEFRYGYRKKKPGKRISAAVLLALCLFAAAAGVLLRRGRGGSGEPVYPKQGREPPEMVYFLQGDPEWAGDRLGQARDTMASSGCLVCCLAAGLDIEARESGQDFYMTAGELNKAFSEAEVYTEGGAVIWGRVADAVPGTESYVADGVQAEEIDALLSDGIFPVVKVRVGGYGAYHWVLVTGSDGDGYLCMDPMDDAGEPVPLSAFKDRVYAMRAVYWKR